MVRNPDPHFSRALRDVSLSVLSLLARVGSELFGLLQVRYDPALPTHCGKIRLTLAAAKGLLISAGGDWGSFLAVFVEEEIGCLMQG